MPSLRVCMIGDFSSELDEGYKNVSHYLATELERRHEVLRFNRKDVAHPGFWRGLGAAPPDVIHAIAQPTAQSLILTRLLQRRWPAARSVVSALRADRFFGQGAVTRKQRWPMRFARPNLVLVQSEQAARLFKQLGCAVKYLPNGTDFERFRPVKPDEKRALRAQYGLELDSPVVLHVGHLEPKRNLLSLRRLPGAGVQVVIAGSLYMGTRPDLIESLRAAGFQVIAGYQPRVEQLYMLADLYVFPVRPGDSLSMPLSVLEAMACNLPVLTTRFSGLEGAFGEGRGLRFVDFTDDMFPAVQQFLASPASISTRDQALPFSWSALAERLEEYYTDLVSGEMGRSGG